MIAFGTGFDVSGSDSRIERTTGPYHSKYVSVGRGLGRAVYLSVDYSTSLSVVHFLRSDGVIIETKKPGNKAEMISPDKPNAKALHELLHYYMQERYLS